LPLRDGPRLRAIKQAAHPVPGTTPSRRRRAGNRRIGHAGAAFVGVVMTWIILVLAGLFEVVWAVGLKYTHGFTRLVPSLVTVAGMAISFWLLALAMKTLPLGTAYAIWVGIGTIGAFIAGIVLFGESTSWMRIVSVGLIVLGLVGLKLSSA
jgi:quaternary ammonium compound-resistance protein SugE